MSVEPLQSNFDIVVVGGGITGAGVARDAALRGLSCLLLEKGDFSAGASSKTTRLIHGGLRYLEQGNLSLVMEALHERELLLRMAPHLIHPIPILLPVYRTDSRKLGKIRFGLWLYDVLSLGKGTPHYGVLGAREVMRKAPFLTPDQLNGAGLFYDYQIPFPERLVLENIFSAREVGAYCLNYREVVAIADAEDGFAVEVRNALDGARCSYTAKVVINAGGPWADRVCALYRRGLAQKVQPTKGTHIVVHLDLDHAVFTSSPRDDRLFFSLPLAGLTLVGTTDTPWNGDSDRVDPAPDEAEYLLEGLGKLMTRRRFTASDVLWAYAGLRPLAVQKNAKSPSSISRAHVLHREGPGGRFLTIVGGKYTTFRRMAEEVVDAACRSLRHRVPCCTDRVPLFGGGLSDRVIFRENLCEWARDIPYVCRDFLGHLVSLYGRRASDVIDLTHGNEPWCEPIAPGYEDFKAQVVHAVRSEDAHHLDDVILRRLSMGLTPDRGLSGARIVARLMAEELGWDEARTAGELAHFRELMSRELVFAGWEGVCAS